MEEEDDWLEQVMCSFTWNTIGVEAADGSFVPMFPQQCFAYGRNITKSFSASADYQTSLSVKIYAGDRPLAKNNRLLEELRMYDLAPKGINRFNVTLLIDINDCVHVTVADVVSGRSLYQVIDGYQKTFSEEKKSLRRDAREHAENDDALRKERHLVLELPPSSDVSYLVT
ncbi:hypothetical protein AAVH_18775 [Aphelenchoides avenae]|nr:hypothetical protein AAVH_18775 [Aphelenchus avenae]